MRITQGTFSFLPEFSDEEVAAQVQYCIDSGWACAVEYTDDPHPRNSYWEMWDLPMFEVEDASAVVFEINKCIEAFPNHYIKFVAYDPRPNRATTALDLIVNRPAEEPGFMVERTEVGDRRQNYTLKSYAAQRPHGDRYEGNSK